ncbi:transporter substrate-binding domain-containing protein [Paracoccus caeni]|uniref:Transporter substrate-binding domain-containing protein n=1 Tax=Paracoccus caeni TaxID=657651 RepID=A0A934SJL9_9RHOB|nr:transporter substrate-binding domain-containing protein [Paracoccus caeni]MBK4215638.1 transporter substrate-binding domain-containing protein [Paracoccus caeni]
MSLLHSASTEKLLLKLLLFLLLMALPLHIRADQIMVKRGEDSTTTNSSEKILIIGVREDAPPFSEGPVQPDRSNANLTVKSGPLRAAGYDGYMIYICDEVLKQMMIVDGNAPTLKEGEFKVVNVDELMRGTFLDDRIELLDGGEIDILCDPASINRERLREYAVSPPLFLTGISYLMREGDVEPQSICGVRKALIGVVGRTNAFQYGIEAILNSGAWARKRDVIIAAMRNTGGNRPTSCPDAGHQGAIWRATSHMELAEAFCKGEVTYYVGDLEIIQASVERFPGCRVTSGAQRFTTDRYAIFARMNYDRGENWKAIRIARFYELLNRGVIASDSLLDHAYDATFHGAPRSQILELFYWSMRGAR